MDPYQVVIKPLITEKGTNQNEDLNQCTFQVHQRANKQQIREAVHAGELPQLGAQVGEITAP